jgi:hypothetical protein
MKDFLLKAEKAISKSERKSEKDIEDEFVNFASKRGCKALKLVLLNKRGFPDRTVICPKAKVMFIEFKKPGEMLKATQCLWKKLLESYGFRYRVCYDSESASTELDMFLHEMDS